MRGDQLRAYQQIRHLAERHRITLLSFGAPEGDEAGRVELMACCERVIVAERHRLGMLWRGARALLGRLPLQVAIYDSVPTRAHLSVLLAEGKFDLAHIQLARLGPLLQRLHHLPCVLDLVDALSVNMAQRALFDRGPMAWIARIEAGRMAVYERTLCAVADALAISSTPDKQAINADNVHLVRNGFDLRRFPFRAPKARTRDVVFIGNLGYFPNIDAASWFARDVMPLLSARMPDARFLIVGARPQDGLRRLAASIPQVELIGEVADVYPYLAAAAVAVVPLRAGSGQQLKLIEAMAAGTPVVATSRSAAGMDARAETHLLIADDAEAMAAAVARLLDDPQLCTRLTQAARALVERLHSWDASARDLERLWIDTAQKPR